MKRYEDPYWHYTPMRHYSDNQKRDLTHRLFSQWGKSHFLNIKEDLLDFIQETHISINDNITGRSGLALWDAYVMGALLYKTSMRFRNANKYCYLETGTAFGGSAIFARKMLDHFGKFKQTVITIDPLDGFYEGTDPFTDTIASEELFWKNVEACDVNTNLKLIKGSSYAPETLEQVTSHPKEYELHTLFIDGDHRYHGAKGDWDYYSPLVIPYGHALFHDYRMKPVPESHPNYHELGEAARDYGINRFVKDEVVGLPGWINFNEAIPANIYVLRKI